jgi:hypothetical protein
MITSLRRGLASAFACLLLAAPLAAQAQDVAVLGPNVPLQAQAYGAVGAAATAVDATHGLPVSCLAGCASAVPFVQTGHTTLAVTTTSGRVALPSADQGLWVQNTGSVDLTYRLGNGSVTALTTDAVLKAGAWAFFSANAQLDIAAITASGTTSLDVQTGTGAPTFSGGGGGGGGGGVVTQPTAANLNATVVFGSPQPISATALPLPTGAAADTTLGNQQATPGSDATKAVAVQGVTGGKPVPVSGALTANLGTLNGASTAANQATEVGSLATIATNTTGAASAANQTTANSSLATIATNTTGASTAANQSTQISSLSTIVTNTTGASTATLQTSANTKLDQLHTDMVAPTVAGENHVGEVGGRATIASASLTTPAGASAYASGQLIANSATAGSVTPLTFAVCRINQGTGMVRRARLKTPDTGFAGQAVTVKLYRDSPTNSNGDHAAWLTTESNYIGSIAITLDQHFSDNEKGIGAPAVGSEINFDCAAGSQNLYGELVAGGPITPQGAKAFTLVLETLVN